jgi:hypothetical protein
MDCANILFSGHAIRRIFERSIRRLEVIEVVTFGHVIADYPDDEPFPSFLILGFVGNRPLHVVAAVETESKHCYIVTAYEPDPAVWQEDFSTRRSS